jgi:hypothetical protein
MESWRTAYEQLGKQGWAPQWAPANYGSDYRMTYSLTKDGQEVTAVEANGATPEQTMADAVRKAEEWIRTHQR